MGARSGDGRPGCRTPPSIITSRTSAKVSPTRAMRPTGLPSAPRPQARLLTHSAPARVLPAPRPPRISQTVQGPPPWASAGGLWSLRLHRSQSNFRRWTSAGLSRHSPSSRAPLVSESRKASSNFVSELLEIGAVDGMRGLLGLAGPMVLKAASSSSASSRTTRHRMASTLASRSGFAGPGRSALRRSTSSICLATALQRRATSPSRRRWRRGPASVRRLADDRCEGAPTGPAFRDGGVSGGTASGNDMVENSSIRAHAEPTEIVGAPAAVSRRRCSQLWRMTNL